MIERHETRFGERHMIESAEAMQRPKAGNRPFRRGETAQGPLATNCDLSRQQAAELDIFGAEVSLTTGRVEFLAA